MEEMRNRKRRRSNLVVMGLLINSEEHEQMRYQMEHFFAKHLKVNATVANITRIGRKSYTVKLTSVVDKLRILRNKQELAAQGICVFIDADMTSREQTIRDAILERVEHERAKGNQIRTGHLRLVIRNKMWVWDDRKNKLVREVKTLRESSRQCASLKHFSGGRKGPKRSSAEQN